MSARLTRDQVRARLLDERIARRQAEQRDALDFLVNGEDEHECVCDVPCSRTYDPLPYPEAEPTPSDWYAGTGIGALYDLPGSERHAWQLAGWNVVPGSSR